MPVCVSPAWSCRRCDQQRKTQPEEASRAHCRARARIQPSRRALTSISRACRSCHALALAAVLDLGEQPFATFFPDQNDGQAEVATWPLRAMVCKVCWLVQLDEVGTPPEPVDLSTDALAETSPTMRNHRRRAVDELVDGLGVGPTQRVIEMASHGNYLTGHFKARGIRTLVFEPDAQRAARLEVLGQPVERANLGVEAAAGIVARHGHADLIVDDYLLSHHPDVDDAIAGLGLLLAPGGTISLEFDHVLSVIEDVQFDAIRHGHYTYLSLLALQPALARHGLAMYDAIPVSVYGGAVRALIGHVGDRHAARPESVQAMLDCERKAGLDNRSAYSRFSGRVAKLQGDLRGFLIQARDRGDLVVGYGAPSRAVTLLQSCGVTPDLLPYTVDRSISKQGRRMPGTGIPIEAPARLLEDRPRYVLILTWSLADEVKRQLRQIRGWGGHFVVPIPDLKIVNPDQDR